MAEVKAVRLVRNRQGRSKGFAYIEYHSDVCVKPGVKHMSIIILLVS